METTEGQNQAQEVKVPRTRRAVALITVGLFSSSLMVAGATSANAQSDTDELLKDAQAAGVGELFTGKSAIDLEGPITSSELVQDPDYSVGDTQLSRMC